MSQHSRTKYRNDIVTHQKDMDIRLLLSYTDDLLNIKPRHKSYLMRTTYQLLHMWCTVRKTKNRVLSQLKSSLTGDKQNTTKQVYLYIVAISNGWPTNSSLWYRYSAVVSYGWLCKSSTWCNISIHVSYGWISKSVRHCFTVVMSYGCVTMSSVIQWYIVVMSYGWVNNSPTGDSNSVYVIQMR